MTKRKGWDSLHLITNWEGRAPTHNLVLLGLELGPERLGHDWWWRTWETHNDLKTVVDEPLKGSQGTDHDDTRSQTSPHSYMG